MKRVFSTALVMLMLLVTGTTRAEVFTGNCGANGDNLTWSLVTGSCILTIKGNGAMADYERNSLAPWLNLSITINDVVVEEGVTTLGAYAFFDCFSLTSVSLPEGLTTISDHVFANCQKITNIKIPSTVTSIGEFAFLNCYDLESFVIPEGVTKICKRTFAFDKNLASVTIPNTVTTIDENAFSRCSNLTSVTLPASLKSIGDYAFEYCENLTSLTCEAVNPPSLESGSFCEVPTNKATLYVPYESLNNYKKDYYWKEFTNILPIPGTEPLNPYAGDCGANGDNVTWNFDPDSGVLTIEGSGDMADFEFENIPWKDFCNDIEGIVVSAGVTSIGETSFYHCSNVTSVTLPDGLKKIGSSAFVYCI